MPATITVLPVNPSNTPDNASEQTLHLGLLDTMAVDGNVAPSTQNQALEAVGRHT